MTPFASPPEASAVTSSCEPVRDEERVGSLTKRPRGVRRRSVLPRNCLKSRLWHFRKQRDKRPKSCDPCYNWSVPDPKRVLWYLRKVPLLADLGPDAIARMAE